MKNIFFLSLLLLSFELMASTILVVGDSHTVGPFGWKLDENLRADGNVVSTYASCGSIAGWWFDGKKTTCGYLGIDEDGKRSSATTHPTPLIKNLLSDLRPEIVILAFGSNYVKTPSDDFVRSDVKKLLKVVKDAGAKCFWIAPPDMRLYRQELPRIKKLLDEVVDCPMFDSRSVTHYPASGGDGIHYWSAQNTPIARSWADAAFKFFKENL